MSDEMVPIEVPDEGVREERGPEYVELGQWYWLRDDGEEELTCVTHVGSNYIKLKSVPGVSSRYGSSWRVHLDNVHKELRLEPDAHRVIRENAEKYRRLAASKMEEVREVTARLGMTPKGELEAGGCSTALATVSGHRDVDDYKKALVKAKTESLPELFKEIEEAHKTMASWLSAPALEMGARMGAAKDVVDRIDDQIFTVELYAGLSEQIDRVATGEPAPTGTVIHLMQRRHYMDEECLANYRHGGMEFDDICDFDEWLAEPENRDRILPFPRTVVAFRVRRKVKDRSEENRGENPFVRILRIMRGEEADRKTFLYIRNGENLYRLSCEHDFGEKLFPDNVVFKSQKLWWENSHSCRDMGSFITDDDHRTRLAERARLKPVLKEAKKAHEAFAKRMKGIEGKPEYSGEKGTPEWEAAHKEERRLYWEMRNIEDEIRRNRVDDYRPFSPGDVYYDDMNKQLEELIKKYNRLAFVLQGLLDRSPVFHPHPPVQLWTPEGMAAAIKMVRDDDHALHAGEKPDIQAYLAENRKHLREGCRTIGQEDCWAEREASKENARTAASWRAERTNHIRFHPYGDPGPGYISKVVKMAARSRRCTYEWTRERRSEGYGRDGRWHSYGDPIPCRITVPPERLFVVDAYRPGDYKRFFADPRTRLEYLEWAPLLLAAEEWHAGNMAEDTESVSASRRKARELDGDDD